jgi:hypothetical protein
MESARLPQARLPQARLPQARLPQGKQTRASVMIRDFRPVGLGVAGAFS